MAQPLHSDTGTFDKFTTYREDGDFGEEKESPYLFLFYSRYIKVQFSPFPFENMSFALTQVSVARNKKSSEILMFLLL